MRKWLNVELKRDTDTCVAFLYELKSKGIQYEASDCGFGYTHYEVLVSDKEAKELNQLLGSMEG